MKINNSKLVSVVLTSFNHAEFIEEAIASILNQSITNFELIIVDDGSSDKSQEIINQFSDPRIVKIFTSRQGPSKAMSMGVQKAKGKYIALMTSDDVSEPNRLELQLLALEKYSDRAAIFTKVRTVGRRNFFCSQKSSSMEKLFNTSYYSTQEIIRHFFYKGNFICGPTLMTTKQLLKEVSNGDNFNHSLLFQLQDFDLWIRIAKKADLVILPEQLFKYRIHSSNLSKISVESLRAINTESFLIYKDFFEGMSNLTFYGAFEKDLAVRSIDTINRSFDECILLLRSDHRVHNLIGLTRLHEIFKDEVTQEAFKKYANMNEVELATYIRGRNLMVSESVLDLSRFSFLLKATHLYAAGRAFLRRQWGLTRTKK